MNDSFGTRMRLATAAGDVDCFSLRALERAGMAGIDRLPMTVKVLLEAALRTNDGFAVTDAHVQALAAGVRVTGCTVHLVRPAMDTGPILVQGLVPVLPGDSVETLSRRTLEVEHVCYPLALDLVASGRVTVDGGRARIEGVGPADLLVRHPLLGGG